MTTVACIYCSTDFPDSLGACPSCGMAQAAPARALPLGTKLQGGKFTVGRVLGEGGFGITYQGAHTPLQRTVALKELFPEEAVRAGTRVLISANRQDEFRQAKESILQEARLIASLNSPHIVDVHDMFRENGTAYIVMEHLAGQTLQAEIDGLGQLSPDRVRQIALDTCEGLTVLHGSRLLHRDIKPTNIMLTVEHAVLIDFGSAREYAAHKTMQHTRILTEDYAAPEQYSTEARFGPYTDIFCLGAALFHALTGAPPARALERFLSTDPAVSFQPGLPRPLCAAIRQALQLRTEDRPQDIETFRKVLLGSSATAARAPRASSTRSDLKNAVGYTNQASEAEPLSLNDRTLSDLNDDLVESIERGVAPENASPVNRFYRQGYARVKMERHARAIADFDQVLQLKPGDVLAYFSRGYCKARLEHHAEALADFDRVLRLRPSHVLAYIIRGYCKARLERHAEAITDYDQALRLPHREKGYSPPSMDSWKNTVPVMNRKGRWYFSDGTNWVLIKSTDTVPTLPNGSKLLAHFSRGYSKAKLEHHAEAIADYDKALQLTPNLPLAYHNRGNANVRLEHYAEAIADYDQVLRLDSGNTAAYRNRRDLERLLGR